MWRDFVTAGAPVVVPAHGGGLVLAAPAGPSQCLIGAMRVVVACAGAASCHDPADICQAERGKG